MSEAGLEQKYVKEAFDTNWVVPMGPNVNAFEQDLARFVNGCSDGSELDRKVVCCARRARGTTCSAQLGTARSGQIDTGYSAQ